jgi:hypothetical protein
MASNSERRVMALFGLFRRAPPVQTLGDLSDFIDANAAFLAQKGIYEYSRARAGHYAKVLFHERGFRQAVELSRWQAFPLTLAMVGEMVAGVVHPHAEGRRAALDVLIALVLAMFDRYPTPAQIGDDAWRTAREELALRLNRIGTHPPKLVKDIPEPLAESYFNLLPIHEKLRGRDFLTTRNYLRVALINIHDELVARLDAPAIAAALRARSDGAG